MESKEIKEKLEEAKRLLYALCPSPEFGESPEAEQLDEILTDFSEINKSLEERIFECINFLIQKTDAEGKINPEKQRIFDFVKYIEDGKYKPF